MPLLSRGVEVTCTIVGSALAHWGVLCRGHRHAVVEADLLLFEGEGTDFADARVRDDEAVWNLP